MPASAQEKLQALNPEVRLVARHTRIDEENAGELLGGLMTLRRGEAHLAPVHLLDEQTGGIVEIPG